MPIELNEPCRNTTLSDEYSNMGKWYNSTLPSISEDHYVNIGDFYDRFVYPKLPDTDTVIAWTKLLLKYVNEDYAVFAIRKFASWTAVTGLSSDKDSQLAISAGKKPGDKNPYSLRRGFVTTFNNSKHKYFFTDNFFAAYFIKMAFDGFVPNLKDFLDEMKKQLFPARFGRFCKEERAMAKYDITGKTAKDPKINNAGYKIGHVIDAGMDYVDALGVGKNMNDICKLYFSRGYYDDWKQNGGVRDGGPISGLDYLKAHFLRFACPINYFLAPKENAAGAVHQTYGPDSGLITNKPDIAELPELQEYIIGKFHKLYGDIFEDYLNAIMWKATPKDVQNELNAIESKMKSLASKVIDLDVIATTSPTTRVATGATSGAATKAAASASKGKSVGSKAYREFSQRIQRTPPMSPQMLKDLQNLNYCKKNFKINFPVLSTSNTGNRYYVTPVGVYYICSQWYKRNEPFLDVWLKNNP